MDVCNSGAEATLTALGLSLTSVDCDGLEEGEETELLPEAGAVLGRWRDWMIASFDISL